MTRPSGKDELRRRAKERMKSNAATGPSDPKADTPRLIQKLQIHQIELEMQNEELIKSRNETDVLMADSLVDKGATFYFTLPQKLD